MHAGSSYLYISAGVHGLCPSSVINNGVDLSKILGGQTKILWEQKVAKSDKCTGVSQLLWGGTCLGCPPKSTPIVIDIVAKQKSG